MQKANISSQVSEEERSEMAEGDKNSAVFSDSRYSEYGKQRILLLFGWKKYSPDAKQKGLIASKKKYYKKIK